MIGVGVVQGPRCLAAEHDLVDPDHQRAGVQALRHPRLEVARAVKLFEQPRFSERLRIRRQFVGSAARGERIERGFGGEHARLDGAMTPLDARGIEKAGVVSYQTTAGESHSGQRLQSPCSDRPGAIGDALAAFEETADRRVGLVTLKFLVGIEIGIRIAQSDDEADRNLVVLEVVQE